jgi:hypothetical protein
MSAVLPPRTEEGIRSNFDPTAMVIVSFFELLEDSNVRPLDYLGVYAKIEPSSFVDKGLRGD